MPSNRTTARAALALCAALLALPSLARAGDTLGSRSGGNRWGADYFPNVELTTHLGNKVRFFDDLIKDKVVVINFIYTSCPDACPLETARLAEVQGILGDRVGKDVFIYSITIDPARDTPEVLAEYAERFQAGPGWLFLTGDEVDITTLRKKLGLYIPDLSSDNPNDHNLNLRIGNQKTGRWMKSSPFENPYVLATQIGSWLHNFKIASDGTRPYEEAPELRDLGMGETLFRTRCAVCHIVGDGDGRPRVGPDLFGVTDRRDREWLERWIAAPDEMLAAEDPIAMGLFLAYNKVPMPNMRLTPLEIDRLLEYVETESRRVDTVRRIASAAPPATATEGEPHDCCQKGESAVLSSVETPAAPEPAKACCAEGEGCCDERGGRTLSTATVLLAGVLGAIGLVLRVRL